MLFNYVLFLYEENVGFIWYHLAFFFGTAQAKDGKFVI